MKSGSTLVPTWQGEGQSKQHSCKPGRNHLQRSRRNVVITAHIDGCRHVLPSVHEVGRTLFFKQEILIDPCLPLNMECYSPKKPLARVRPKRNNHCEPGPQAPFPKSSPRATTEGQGFAFSSVCLQARPTSPTPLHSCRS